MAIKLAALSVLLLLAAAEAGFPDCPQHCSCTQSSFSGGKARCSVLDPGSQRFSPDISSLVVEGSGEERLSARMFADLGLTGLLTLSLTHGALTHVHRDAFLGLDYLEDLDLSHNRLERLEPDTLRGIRLKRLNLDGNPLALSEPFPASDTLVELTLARCNLSAPAQVRALAGLTNLEYLDLSGNRIRELKDDMFTSLVNLEEINLADNAISHIDRDTFADIEELSSLNLRGNPLKTLEGIEIPGLNDLDVSNCNFFMLAASTLEGFPELSSLNLSQNAITTIDMDAFMSVPGLKDLDLSYNKLRGPLNELLFEFNKRLETISFQGNTEIKYLSGFKGDFPHLYNYDISKCGLTSINNETFIGMGSLVSLNASGNSIVYIEPKTFAELPNLLVLDLSSNVLHSLNNKLFANNGELNKLYLSKNFFRHISPQLFIPTPKLHHLDLSDCRLTSLWNISESFMMRNRHILSKLTYLNVSGNRLTKLHMHYFISLENVKELDISNNPIECTSDFSHVMQWIIMKKVMPDRRGAVSGDLIENNVQWDEVLRSVCPPESVAAIPVLPPADDADDNVVPLLEETPLVWPLVLVWASIFSILFALANIVGLLLCRARRAHSRTPLQLHFPTRRGERRLYQKLYEECSIPAPVHSANKLQFVAVLGNAFSKSNSDV